MRGPAAVFAVLATLATTSSVARAQEPAKGPRILVPPLQVEGNLSDEWTLDFEARMLEGLGRAAATVVPSDAPATCTDPTCWQQLGRDQDVAFIAVGQVTKEERDFELRVDLVSGADGRVVATVQQPCDLCGLGEVGDLLVGAAATVASRIDALASAKSLVAFETVPAGATIVLDGVLLGEAPLNHEVAAGKHSAEASKRDYVTQVRTFDTEGGADQVVRFDLQARPKDRGRLRTAGWTLLGVGGAGILAGTVLLVMDERDVSSRCTGDNVNAQGICKYRYDTRTGGIITMALGVTAIVTGVAIAIATRPDRERRVAIGPGSLRFRF